MADVLLSRGEKLFTVGQEAQHMHFAIRGEIKYHFEDPSTGAPRLACGFYADVRVYDPVAGGEALFVIEAGAEALAVFTGLGGLVRVGAFRRLEVRP